MSASGETLSDPLREDLQAVADLVPAGSIVLDLGCSDGRLLEYLVRWKAVRGRGIELSEDGVLACVRRGLSVRQGDLNEGLADYPTRSVDYVILSQTLPFLNDAPKIISEMMRVGKHGIVSFPNWGYWRFRLALLFTGRIPTALDYPNHWQESRRWQPFTIADFNSFCREQGVRIERCIFLSNHRRLRTDWAANLFAGTAVFVLKAE